VIQAQIPLVDLSFHATVLEYYIITYTAVLFAFIALCRTFCPRRNEAEFLEFALNLPVKQTWKFLLKACMVLRHTEEENWYHSEVAYMEFRREISFCLPRTLIFQILREDKASYNFNDKIIMHYFFNH
jgi:hypothetical protein